MTIFFLEADFLQFSEDLQYGMSYVWLYDCWLLIKHKN
jgi:hypothetical protein